MSIVNGAALQQQALQWECELPGEARCLTLSMCYQVASYTSQRFFALFLLNLMNWDLWVSIFFCHQHDCLHCVEQHLLGVVGSSPSLSPKKASVLKSVRFSLCKQYPIEVIPFMKGGVPVNKLKQ